MAKHMRSLVAVPTVFLFACTLGTAAISAGCDRVTQQTEAQRLKLKEQNLIQAYSENVAAVDRLQTAFTDSWKTANEQTNIKDLKEAFDSRVLPALRAYVKALGEMPVGSEALTNIHDVLVRAYGDVQKVFEGFSKGLTEDNIIERHRGLLVATDKVHAAERKYYGDLKAYYSEFNVTLVEQPAPSAGTKAAGQATGKAAGAVDK